MKIFLTLAGICLTLAACNAQTDRQKTNTMPIPAANPAKPTITKSDEAWRKQLTSAEYDVLRDHGTERAFTGTLLNNHNDGVFVCKACQYELFSSTTKFESGTGWPSFYDQLQGHVATTTDDAYGMVRTEVHCARCGSHLGHVFNDGPKPTGLRYCINSVSIAFKDK